MKENSLTAQLMVAFGSLGLALDPKQQGKEYLELKTNLTSSGGLGFTKVVGANIGDKVSEYLHRSEGLARGMFKRVKRMNEEQNSKLQAAVKKYDKIVKTFFDRLRNLANQPYFSPLFRDYRFHSVLHQISQASKLRLITGGKVHRVDAIRQLFTEIEKDPSLSFLARDKAWREFKRAAEDFVKASSSESLVTRLVHEGITLMRLRKHKF